MEKTVHSATSAIYTASEIRSVMSHSETQENNRKPYYAGTTAAKYASGDAEIFAAGNQVNTQSILPENTGHTEQPVYNGSSEKYEAKAAQFHAPVSETYKYQKTGQTSCPGTAVEKYTTGNTEICANRSGTFPCRREATNNPFYFKKYRFRTGR